MTGRPDEPDDRPSHPAALGPEILARACDFHATRRSGPGGQNRNKVETAVVLVHRPTGVRAEASERRTQGENRRAALARLRIELALTIRSDLDIGEGTYRPSALWRSRNRGGRIVVNPEHDDFPALLAEALDVLAAHDDDLPAAAKSLECTTSQLVGLLRKAPRALARVNERRRRNGSRPLR